MDRITIIDTHCHIQLPQYDADRDQVIRRALDAGVGMLCVGIDLDTSWGAVELAEQHENIWASVGLHPNDNLYEDYNQELYASLAQHPKVVAIGEIGLDYYRTTAAGDREIQKKRFMYQLELAQKNNKPVIIHCRDGSTSLTMGAHKDMITILKDIKATKQSLRGVIHSFTGTPEQAADYVAMGYYIGFNGIITFTRDYDDVIRSIPVERILLETDAPYLTPVPNRGKRNEPSYIIEVSKMLSKIKGQDVLAIVLSNSNVLFDL